MLAAAVCRAVFQYASFLYILTCSCICSRRGLPPACPSAARLGRAICPSGCTCARFLFELLRLTGSSPIGVFVQRSVDDQLDVVDSQNKDVVIYSYIFMFGYIVLALGRFPHPVKTRISLGLQGIFIVAGSAAGAIGIVSVAGAC